MVHMLDDHVCYIIGIFGQKIIYFNDNFQENKDREAAFFRFFKQVAGDDCEIDAWELKNCLDQIFAKGKCLKFVRALTLTINCLNIFQRIAKIVLILSLVTNKKRKQKKTKENIRKQKKTKQNKTKNRISKI